MRDFLIGLAIFLCLGNCGGCLYAFGATASLREHERRLRADLEEGQKRDLELMKKLAETTKVGDESLQTLFLLMRTECRQARVEPKKEGGS